MTKPADTHCTSSLMRLSNFRIQPSAFGRGDTARYLPYDDSNKKFFRGGRP